MREIVKIVINRGPRGLTGPAGPVMTGEQIVAAIDAAIGTAWRTGGGASTAEVLGDGDGSILGDGDGSMVGDPSA